MTLILLLRLAKLYPKYPSIGIGGSTCIGSWFVINFGLGFQVGFNGFKKTVSVRGSLRDDDKAIRRQGTVDWADRAWLKVRFSLLSTFFEC